MDWLDKAIGAFLIVATVLLTLLTIGLLVDIVRSL